MPRGRMLRGDCCLTRSQRVDWENPVLNLLESLTNRLTTQRKFRQTAERLSRSYQCRCGTTIFFRNTQCLNCKSPLGYLPDTLSLVALSPGSDPNTISAEGQDGSYKYCGNRLTAALCNWLVEGSDPNPLCIACRLNRTIPDLNDNARSKRRNGACLPTARPRTSR